MGEIIWVSPIRRIGDKRPNYMYNKDNNIVDFRTIKDKCELGYIDLRTKVLYFNRDYKNKFKAIKNQIIKDYEPNSVAEYISLV